MSSKPITVLVADDHAIMRQGLSSLLKDEGGFQVIGEAQTGREAVKMAQELQPDVILMDIAMPVLNGLEATRQIRSQNPEAKVIILSAHSEDIYVEQTVAAGVSGFIEKQSSSDILAQAIRDVVKGGVYFSPAIARRRRRQSDAEAKGKNVSLTSRENEVLQLVA